MLVVLFCCSPVHSTARRSIFEYFHMLQQSWQCNLAWQNTKIMSQNSERNHLGRFFSRARNESLVSGLGLRSNFLRQSLKEARNCSTSINGRSPALLPLHQVRVLLPCNGSSYKFSCHISDNSMSL